MNTSTQDQNTPTENNELKDQIRKTSPDGRPAHPKFRAKEIFLLAGGSLLAILAVSGVTYALWGANEAYLVLGLGMIFALLGNPVVWAMFFRSKERESIQRRIPSDQPEST